MRTIHTKIEIDAPIDIVWKRIVDFSAYHLWSSAIHIEGIPKRGETLKVNVSLKKGKPMKFKPVVDVCEPEKELSWIGKLMGINLFFVGRHHLQLKSITENKTELIHGEIFKGVLLPILWPFIGRETQKAFERFNQQLARYILEVREDEGN